ncbi:hypothetical protein DTO164E3_7631 [Paecilomyces variotii]|uniref:Carotenoid oxygenase n=1 Tax=Byssochlamys spectabilis TaxID=264951 RepID=A0A443HW07_BYSSP|nr:carotenoid oxygenase [Paecilomyces variotii]KAJ9193873.1 hypothetical protein DTO164E3_7631 [Paecilomyces variotii]KAJ9194831.1 hypothetical protein DTO032I3_7161 [Paecilomyces variotii]KAJ9244722.1 hypothetical protein DTO169E5_1543 [Paecilomyces variotii]KAJ9257041.1 hypothetical protein DTO207G8_2213 [Paecilomyces variotii]KAJ9261360.1 hypothetical protein DTO195F2_4156 [Paecilomyces variotii]
MASIPAVSLRRVLSPKRLSQGVQQVTKQEPVQPVRPYNDWPNDLGFNTTYEEKTPVELQVKGHIPPWAAGVLYRVGTGANEIDTEKGTKFKVKHWFDGLSVVHRFQIGAPENDNGPVRVIYNSRSTCDGLIEKIRKTGNREGVTFAAKYDPCTSYFKKTMSMFKSFRPAEMKPNERTVPVTVSVNFPGLPTSGQRHASGIETLCSKTDANVLQTLDPETLEPIGITSQTILHPDLKGPMSCAHAKSDPISGDVFNYNLEIGPTSTYRIFRVSASTGKTSILATFNTSAAYIHSFFLTQNYVILCVWNSYFTANGATILLNQNIMDSISGYDPTRPSIWYVVDRRSPEEGGQGVIATYESDPFYCFHTVNAYEQPSADGNGVDIIADLASYSSHNVMKRFFFENLYSTSTKAAEHADPADASTRAQYKRFRLPSIPSSPTKSRQKAVLEFVGNPFETPELPTINPSYVLRPHRYVYGIADTGKASFLDGLIKYDTKAKTALVWSEHGQSAGEAIFIPREPGVVSEDGEGEDDGVLLTVVLDGPVGRSYLLVLDAKTMKEVGRAELKGAAGFGFHGTHVSARGSTGVGGELGRGLDF